MYVIKHEVRFSSAKWVFSTSYIFGISQNVLHPDIKFEILKIEDLFYVEVIECIIYIYTIIPVETGYIRNIDIFGILN